jgi:hypothetical protein
MRTQRAILIDARTSSLREEGREGHLEFMIHFHESQPTLMIPLAGNVPARERSHAGSSGSQFPGSGDKPHNP